MALIKGGTFDVLGACASDREVAGFLLGSDKPGDERTGEAENRAKSCGDGILFLPH